MKKFFLLVLIGLFLTGCATINQNTDFCKHSTAFENLEHLKYSIWGYQDTTQDDVKKSKEQNWWGDPVKAK